MRHINRPEETLRSRVEALLAVLKTDKRLVWPIRQRQNEGADGRMGARSTAFGGRLMAVTDQGTRASADTAERSIGDDDGGPKTARQPRFESCRPLEHRPNGSRAARDLPITEG